MNRIIFDLETESRPEHELLAMMPEFEAPGNYKAPEAIAKAISEKRAAWMDRAALDATSGRIVAIGYINGEQFIDSITDETAMLLSLWETVRQAQADGSLMVGFNIARFDVTFAVRRSWHLRIPVPPRLYNGRYLNPSLFLDLAESWQMGNFDDRISLKRLAEFLGIGTKNEDNSKNFGKLLISNRAEALAHLENDLRLTGAIADRLLGKVDAKQAPKIMEEYRNE